MDKPISDTKRLELVVVALPTEEDYVRKLSSEKEPHLTLLYLGENQFDPEQLRHISDYIEYAASLLPRFGLDVESRGELGPNKADVLFFNKRWSKDVDIFRRQLLQDDLIAGAYVSADQFPEWTPHLTMGFPTTPAKKDDREYPGISYVTFDRVALWTGDSSGPVFPLKSNHYDLEVAMSQSVRGLSASSNALKHHGVKGMKWGVRRVDPGGSSSRSMDSADTKMIDAHLKKISAGGTRALNTEELQKVVSRMNLEQQYSKMMAEKSTLDAGHDQVKKALSIGQTLSNIYNLSKSPAGKALRKALVGV
jgi:2'-5' RNA ligase